MKLDPRTVFRTAAIAEAVSWAGLLVGMYFKWVVQSTEVGVKIFGPIHGIIVLAYVLAVLYARGVFRWNIRTSLLAALASVPPFATLVFEISADRRGLLATPEAASGEAVPDESVSVAS